MRDAATRVFSNAAGSYSANVGLTIENGGWDGEEQLQEQFVSRKVRRRRRGGRGGEKEEEEKKTHPPTHPPTSPNRALLSTPTSPG